MPERMARRPEICKLLIVARFMVSHQGAGFLVGLMRGVPAFQGHRFVPHLVPGREGKGSWSGYAAFYPQIEDPKAGMEVELEAPPRCPGTGGIQFQQKVAITFSLARCAVARISSRPSLHL